MLRRVAKILLLTTLLAGLASAEVTLPNVLSDHAVLQRDQPIHLWGFATPGAQLTAHFHGQTQIAVADTIGRFSLYLAPEKAGGPYELKIGGDGREVTVSDLLVGDVWLASGQSNMEMPLGGFPPGASLKNADKEIAAATHPDIRLLVVERKSSGIPVNNIVGTWTQCTPETAKKFSAVAYFFGREVAGKEHVPIGLIDSTWGGTPADAWVSMDTLGSDPALLPAFASRAVFANKETDLDRIVAAEKAEDAQAKAAGRPASTHQWHPPEDSWMPAGLYNGMIAPLSPLTIKGFLWYQGESNATPDRSPVYHRLFSALIGDWRMHFAQGDLPFLYAQISSFYAPGDGWGRVRDEQRRTLSTGNTAMAVTLDIGLPNNVHPPDKQTVGSRLAAAARAMVYGENVLYSGPSFRRVTPELNADGTTSMRVWFDHAEGLTYRGQPATGFEVSGPDGHFVPAQAQVSGETVLVTAKEIANPVSVRFGWSSVVQNSLYNSAGFPASTFSSEPHP